MTDPVPEEVVERIWRVLSGSFSSGEVAIMVGALTPADLRALVAAIMPGHWVAPVKLTDELYSAADAAIDANGVHLVIDGMSAEEIDEQYTPHLDARARIFWRAVVEAAQAGEAGDG